MGISCSVMLEETPGTFHSRYANEALREFKVISDHIHWKTSVKKTKIVQNLLRSFSETYRKAATIWGRIVQA